MNRALLLIAVAGAFVLSGCTVFQDDIYKLQAGQYGSSGFDKVDDAIGAEFKSRFGKEMVFRAEVEARYDNWTFISDEGAWGHERYRTRVFAYPQIDQDGHYHPVVVAKNEVYNGGSMRANSGPKASYYGGWVEAGRDARLEVSLSNAITARVRKSGGGEIGDREVQSNHTRRGAPFPGSAPFACPAAASAAGGSCIGRRAGTAC